MVTLIGLIGLFAWSLSYLGTVPEGRELRYDEITALVQERRIAEAASLDEDAIVAGRYVADPLPLPPGNKPDATMPPVAAIEGEGAFVLAYPKSDAVTGALADGLVAIGAQVDFDKQGSKASARLITTFLLPLLILANLFTLLFTVSEGGGSAIGEVVSFGSIGARRAKRCRERPPAPGQAPVAKASCTEGG